MSLMRMIIAGAVLIVRRDVQTAETFVAGLRLDSGERVEDQAEFWRLRAGGMLLRTLLSKLTRPAMSF